jgi:hypothetical protein
MTREERQQALAEERRHDHEKLVAFGDDELIESWHSTTPTRLLAIKYGVRSSSLAMEWRRLQRASILPLHTRRQHEPSDNDGRPAVTFGDPLLERLRKIHGSWLLGLLVLAALLLTACQMPLPR